MKKNIDVNKLFSDILSCAESYGLCCGIYIQARDYSLSGNCSNFDLDCDFLLDGAGGFILGLTVMKLICDGKLSPNDPIDKYIPDCPLLFPPELTVAHLLQRTSGLPDPLHERMLPEIHSSLKGANADDRQMICREHTAILNHRSLDRQLHIIRDIDCSSCSGVTPSLLEEAVLLEIIEKVTGTAITDYQQRYLFDPLDINSRCGVHDKGTGRLAYAESVSVEYEANANAAVVYTLTFSELVKLANALMKGFPLTEGCWKELLACKLSGITLPYGRRQGVLRAHSSVCGRHTNIFIDSKSKLVVLVASRTPLLARPDGLGGYRRFDIDVIGYINSQRVYPTHTRMERLSHRNISSALSVSLEPEQQNYVASPAVVIAEVATQRRIGLIFQAKRREVFIITDSDITIGILSLCFESTQKIARLDSLIIDRMYQRRGFGRIAVKWAAQHSQREGCSKIVVCVDRRNIPARKLYESEGFKISAVYDCAFVLEFCL